MCAEGGGGGQKGKRDNVMVRGWRGGGGAGGNCIARALGLKIFRQGNEAVLKCF